MTDQEILTKVLNQVSSAPSDAFLRIFGNASLNQVRLVITEAEASEIYITYFKHFLGDSQALAIIAKWATMSTEGYQHDPLAATAIETTPVDQDYADSDDTEVLDDSQSDVSTDYYSGDELDETKTWQGDFMTPAWEEEFWRRNLTWLDKGVVTNYAASTLKDYRSKNIWGNKKFGPKPFQNVEASFAALEKHNETNSFETIKKDLNILKMYLTHMTQDERRKLIQDRQFDDKLKAYYDYVDGQTKEDELMKNQEATDDERAAAMPYPIIVEKALSKRKTIIDNGVENASEDDLMACGHVCLQVVENQGAPRRCEYCTLVGGSSEFPNYYKDGKVVLKEYKTARCYGDYIIDVSDDTRVILDELAKRRGFGQPMFRLKGSRTYTTKQHFNRVTGKPIYSTLLRYLYISHRQLNSTLIWTNEREHLATLMGHSVILQQTTYTKKNLLNNWYAEHPETRPLELVAPEHPSIANPAPATPERKRKRFTPEEDEQLEELLPECLESTGGD
ncbi:hypothetical protein HDU88_009038, partial [Geranomyces variabilis]